VTSDQATSLWVSRSSKNLLPMIRIAITPGAYDAICSTLPEDSPPWHHGGQCLI
jgi:hypothetical protein